jgi:tetratricopeptide (TPR) repeat protein
MRVAAAAALLVLACGVAYAPPALADDKPWAAGVSADDQAKALELYRQGNELFEQARYLEALAKYEVALRAWDHPSIRYNAAVCLINLGRADEAYENLTAALRFGGEPLSAELQRQAATYEKLLVGQLAELEVRCTEPEAKVMLDGKPLLACPGTESRRVRPGNHQLVGEKPGYATDARAIELPAGKKTVIVLELKLLDAGGSPGRLERRWPRWMPWTVLAAGAVIGGISIPLSLAARDDYRAWDAQFAALCPAGCDPSLLAPAQRATLDALDSDRKRSATLAYASVAIGATAIAAGFTLVLLNQPRLVGATVQPEVSADRATVSLVGCW